MRVSYLLRNVSVAKYGLIPNDRLTGEITKGHNARAPPGHARNTHAGLVDSRRASEDRVSRIQYGTEGHCEFKGFVTAWIDADPGVIFNNLETRPIGPLDSKKRAYCRCACVVAWLWLTVAGAQSGALRFRGACRR